MRESLIRVFVVDDVDEWRRFVRTVLQEFPRLVIVGEASDGLEALQKIKELAPVLVLLDIGLPELDGIKVATQIRTVSPNSKIIFLTENRSCDVAKTALQAGASGYVVKSSCACELIPAIKAVLEGKHFMSAKLTA